MVKLWPQEGETYVLTIRALRVPKERAAKPCLKWYVAP